MNQDIVPGTQTPAAAASPAAQATPTAPAGNYQEGSSTITDDELRKATETLTKVTEAYRMRIVGQEGMRVAVLVSLMANGHILIESVPGLAKTTAAATVAKAVEATFHRIQCTPDLLPSDIIGGQVYDYSKGKFTTQLGPVHANFVLLDEINRSSAKTQSAMLEAMQERQTSIAGEVFKLPKPFIVLATQNPIEEEGTYVLPEAQMDRFILKEVISYPEATEELEMLRRIESGVYDKEDDSELPHVSTDDIIYLQDLTKKVYVDQAIKDYIVRIVTATRNPHSVIQADLAKYVQFGASPRASIALMQVARSLALLSGRRHVIPEDVKQLRHSVLRHRILLNFEAAADKVHPEAIIDAIYGAVQTP